MYKKILISGLFCLGLFAVSTGMKAQQGTQSPLDRAAKLVTEAQLATLYSSGCGQYCKTTAETCSPSPGSMCKTIANVGSICNRCMTDTSIQQCVDNPFYDFSGSTCNYLDSVKCGNTTSGGCLNDGRCGSQNDSGGKCGSATKCETKSK